VIFVELAEWTLAIWTLPIFTSHCWSSNKQQLHSNLWLLHVSTFNYNWCPLKDGYLLVTYLGCVYKMTFNLSSDDRYFTVSSDSTKILKLYFLLA